MNKNKNTIVVAAMYCSGKTTLANDDSNKYSIVDLDDKWGKVKLDTARFLTINRTRDILRMLGKCDIILVHPSKILFKELEMNHIDYVLVYAEDTKECMDEWGRRNAERHSENFWRTAKHSWHRMLDDFKHNRSAKKHYVLKPDQHLSDIIDQIYADNHVEEVEDNSK